MVEITALSSYLLEDLYEYHGFDFLQFDRKSRAEQSARYPTEQTLRSGDGELCRCGTSRSPFKGARESVTQLLRSPEPEGCSGGDVVSSVFTIVRRALTETLSGDGVNRCHQCVDFKVGEVDDSWDRIAHPSVEASRSLVRSVPKKFRDQITASAEDAAYQKFIRINNRCAEWVLNTQFSWEEELVGLLKKELDDFFHPGGDLLVDGDSAIFDRGRCGPGASLGANGVDFYTKLFSSDLTATSFDVYYSYAAWCAADPNWRDAEFTRLTTFGLPKITCESQVTFVPKNRDTLRTICTEPSLNMFAQLGFGAILEDRLDNLFGINLSDQPERNAELARLGSIDGAIATIDLESASDSMSLGMLAEVLPQWVFDTLCAYRSPTTRVRGERVLLHMVSTMGNGYTFPLQTILFACAVRAVAKQMSVSLRRADSVLPLWGVFGDDIALPTPLVDRLCRLLDILGFQVNGEKSYTDKYGTFRESCGYDYYRGHNVRGVYIKSLLTPQSRYVAINLLNDWSARWGIPLRRAIGYLRDSVKVLAIPPWMSYDAGIRVPIDAVFSGFTSVFRGKWNRNSFLFRYYAADIPSLRILEDVIAIPRNLNRVPRRVYSPAGLLIAAIGGYLRGGRIPLALKQGENPNYRSRSGATSCWSPTDKQVRSLGLGFWERWKTAVLDNLGY